MKLTDHVGEIKGAYNKLFTFKTTETQQGKWCQCTFYIFALNFIS